MIVLGACGKVLCALVYIKWEGALSTVSPGTNVGLLFTIEYKDAN